MNERSSRSSAAQKSPFCETKLVLEATTMFGGYLRGRRISSPCAMLDLERFSTQFFVTSCVLFEAGVSWEFFLRYRGMYGKDEGMISEKSICSENPEISTVNTVGTVCC